MSLPVILHLDIDAFFASVEQQKDPRLRGRPVIVGAGVIASCSYEARAQGLRAGMPIHHALRICPGAVVMEGRHEVYRCFTDCIFEMCRTLSPAIETYLDEAYVDLTGTERLHGPAEAVGQRLRADIREATGLSVSVGLGPNRMVAKLAGKAAKPGGVRRVREAEVDAFIAGLPVRQLPGVGRVRNALLSRLNIHSIGDLRAVDRRGLTAVFGADGHLLYDRCRGRDTRAVNETEVPRTLSRETTFHRETADPDEIEGMLYYLTERAGRTLRRLGVQARRVEVRLRYPDHKNVSGGTTLAAPTDRDSELFDTALARYRRLHTRRVSLRLVGVALTRLSLATGVRQPDLFEAEVCPEARGRPGLYDALDRIRTRYGHGAVVAGRSLELLNTLRRDDFGYILRAPSLTK